MKLGRFIFGIVALLTTCFCLKILFFDGLPSSLVETERDAIMWIVFMLGAAGTYLWIGIVACTGAVKNVDFAVELKTFSLTSVSLMIFTIMFGSGLYYHFIF